MSQMTVVYYKEKAPESFERSIFLAGPSPKSKESARLSWRPKALKILERKGFCGVVFVPEPRDPETFSTEDFGYEDMVNWEHDGIKMSDCVLFWVPRNLKTLPGFTTNIEFGWLINSGKVVFGAPTKAPKVRYLRYMVQKLGETSTRTLEGTINKAIKFLANGAMRYGGERQVPLYIWHTSAFKSWHEAHKAAGNRIDEAELVFFVRKPREKIKVPVIWGLKVNIYIAAEKRNKWNEGIFARPDISSVVLYERAEDILDSRIVLVKEFRPAVKNEDCFVRDLPGGSAPNFHTNYLEIASEEVLEETGLNIPSCRLCYEGARQIGATLTTYSMHLYSVELKGDEVDYLLSQKNIPHGADLENETGERVYIEVKTLREILAEKLVDWNTLGAITSVLLKRI